MKKIQSFLYAATALMFIAFSWGCIDYISAKNNGLDKTLYKPVAVSKTALPDSNKELHAEYFSRGIIEPPPDVSVKRKKAATTMNLVAGKKIIKQKEMNKLSFGSFSRAPLPMKKRQHYFSDSIITLTDTLMPEKVDIVASDSIQDN